jgi:hypothetical protein
MAARALRPFLTKWINEDSMISRMVGSSTPTRPSSIWLRSVRAAEDYLCAAGWETVGGVDKRRGPQGIEEPQKRALFWKPTIGWRSARPIARASMAIQ